MDPEENFYAAPEAEVLDAPREVGNAEAIRREHVLHESSIRSVGALFMLGGIITLLYGVFAAVVSFQTRNGAEQLVMLGLGGVGLALGAAMVAIGNGLRVLSPKAKIPGVVLSALSLVNLPCGTAVGAYAIYLLLSAKGTVIFSEEYKDVIAATPHVKARTPWYAWLALALVLGLIALGVLSGMRH